MTLILILGGLFAVIGVGASVVYYFARYYVKTDRDDKELLTHRPVELGLEEAPDSEDLKNSDRVSPRVEPKNLNQALAKTRDSFWGRISGLTFKGELDSRLRDELEEILYTSDLGPQTAEKLLSEVTENLSRGERKDMELIRQSLRSQMKEIFSSAHHAEGMFFEKAKTSATPIVWMIVGVNGVGKTTTIGKLASMARAQGLKVMIVAGDTFRAAADSQLKVWAERAGCEIFNPENIKDPSAVAFAGLERAKAHGFQLVIVDTAGRLHTQDHLMEELKKMKRVMTKIIPEAPHERWLVIDANAGQNALMQAREFHQAVELSGVVVTKMDGSSKAGVILGVVNELHVPVTYVGIGEAVEDLRPFDARTFVEAII